MASRTDQFKAAKQEMQRAFEKAEEEESRRIKETDEAKEPSPWLRRVGCITHLAGVNRKEVREFVEPVDEKEEPHLAIMCTAFEWLIQDAQHHAVRDVVGIHTLFEANKKEVEKGTNMPFDSWMDITTIERLPLPYHVDFVGSFGFEDESGKWDPDENWDEDNVAGDDPWDLQAGHGTHIAGMIYARKLYVASVFGVCTDVLGRPHARTKRKRPSFEEEMDDVEAQRWKKLRTVDIQQALKEMFGAGTQFRGLQKPALECHHEAREPHIGRDGDGGGEVDVVPDSRKERVIRNDKLSSPHCQRMGEMRAQIVIVTPESAVSKSFSTFLNDVQGRRELVRIVFDECHTVMDSTPDSRPQMQHLGALSTREVQMVFLTATLPKHTEPEFMRIMKIKPEEVQTFRGPTTRRNIAYSVHEYAEESDETDAICQLVGEKLEQYTAPAKTIVYGGTIERTQQLSKALGCHQYYREVGDRDEKGAIMERWQRGDGRLIVATNAFGLGINAPDVRVAIHAGDIYQMRSYSQESGRGGRDGDRSEAIVVMPAGKQKELQDKIARAKARKQPWKIQSRVMRPWEAKHVEWEKMERFLSGSRCRRIYLDSEMDYRQNRKRCEVGEERCDVCEKDDAMVEAEEARQAAYVEEQRAIGEQAAQDERERQDQWLDSGIDVRSSSMSIPAPSSEVLVSGNAVVASPKPFTDQNPTPSEEEGHSITHARYSSVSFDKGFAADQDPVGESRAFEAQKHQRSQQRLRIEAGCQQEGHKSPVRFVGKCPLCYVRQYQGWEVDVRHTLENCPDESRTKVITEIEALKTIRFEPYASCTFCTVAQKVCTRWAETREGSNRFRKVEGGVCQYDGIVRAAVAAMSIAAPVEVAREGLYGQMKAMGIWGRGEGEWSEEEHAEMKRVMLIWFGKKIIWGGMEASVLLRVFYWSTVGLEDGVESIGGIDKPDRQ
ncbi:hypothetical protein V496_03407 [Pseudogymnoascus sp. VKM F-4515 (FW-2607)]|nr:hypothetical protein V496_03407 [Pseudogymnoascus sp. VKM F-4515 (FW-2607)]